MLALLLLLTCLNGRVESREAGRYEHPVTKYDTEGDAAGHSAYVGSLFVTHKMAQ